jgi:L-aspartate oxidase
VRTIVVGAGAAGLTSAIEAAELGEVVLVAPDSRLGRDEPFEGASGGTAATGWAQGGIAAAVAPGDSPRAHADDTIVAGAGLSDPEAVRILTQEAPAAIRFLGRIGMKFDDNGVPTLEGGHGARRVLHAGGDATGSALLSVLRGAARATDAIVPVEARVDGLLADDGRVRGIRAGGAEIEADRVILATGGACGIFGRRSGPEPTVGSGIALAWSAGAALVDLEFIQFHPTALDVPGHPAHLFTEALRGEGAVLVDGDGRRFMVDVDPRAELAPRDIVARAIAAVRAGTAGGVYLDATRVERVRERFPTAAARAASAGLDVGRDPIPVAPAAHYFTGGVLTDAWGRSTIPGLLACGEVACTGAHGANRLASNSLLEAIVFGRRAGRAEDGTASVAAAKAPLGCQQPAGALSIAEVRSLADRYLGVTRTGAELETIADALRVAPDSGGDGTASLVAWLVATAALRREESRGGHFRADIPEPRPAWRFRQVLRPKGWSSLEPAAGPGALERSPLRV